MLNLNFEYGTVKNTVNLKSIWICLGVVAAFLVTAGCSDLALDDQLQMGQESTLTVNITSATPKGNVTAEAVQVVSADLKLTGPDNAVQQVHWVPGDDSTVVFRTQSFGVHYFECVDVDSLSHTNINATNINMVAGYNYWIHLELGGSVIITNSSSSSSTATSTSSSTTSLSTSSSSAPSSVSSASSTPASSSVPSSSSVSSSSVSSQSSSSTSLATYGLYSETVPISVLWDQDTKLDIWFDWGGGMTLMEDITTSGDGIQSWKLTGTGTWLGMGVRVEPLASLVNMSAYSGGSLRFMYKGTKAFKVGIKSGGSVPVEKWVQSAQLNSFGFNPDGLWHSIAVPMSLFAGVDFAGIEQYFMFVADASMGYTVGSVYYLDNIYWSKIPPASSSSSSSSLSSSSSSVASSSSVSSVPSSSSTASSVISSTSSSSSSSSIASSVSSVSSVASSSSSVASVSSSVSSSSSAISSVPSSSSTSSAASSSSVSSSATTFGLYSETVPISVLWDVDTMMDIWTDWGAGMTVTEDFTTSGDGIKSWKLTGTGTWMGCGIRVNPLSATRDMRAYTNGSLRFMAKGTASFKVGIKSYGSNPVEVWALPLNLATYGYSPDNAWHTVQIPMSAFPSIDFFSIEQYFMFVSDSGMGYAAGTVFNIDNLYWSKTYTPPSSSSSSSVSSSSSSSSSVISSSSSSLPSSSSVSSSSSAVSSSSLSSSSSIVSSSSSSVGNYSTEYNSQVIRDNAGNYVVVWLDYRTGAKQVYARKLNSSYQTVWADRRINPSDLVAGVWDQTPVVKCDSANNLYLVYARTTGDLKLAKLDPNGNLVWERQADSAARPAEWQTYDLALDSSGNIYVVYQIYGPAGTGSTIVKFNNSGTKLWGDITAGQNDPEIAIGAGHIYVSSRGGGIRKFDANGSVLWNASVTAPDRIRIAADSSGNLCAVYNNSFNVFYSKFNTSGTQVTGPLQISVGGVIYLEKALADIAIDSGNNKYIVFRDRYSSPDGYDYVLKAQKLNSSDAVQWTAGGERFCQRDFIDQGIPAVAPDGAGGLFAVWYDTRYNEELNVYSVNNIYANRVLTGGTRGWVEDMRLSSGTIPPYATPINSSLSFVIYAETAAQNVTWPTDCAWYQSASSPNVFTEQTLTVCERTYSWKLKINSNYLDMYILKYPLYTYTDLSAYASGTYNFLVKAKNPLYVGITKTYSIDPLVRLDHGQYGFKTNNTWCVVSIPMSVFTAKGVNLSMVDCYMHVFAGSGEGIVGGEEYYIDRIYFSR